MADKLMQMLFLEGVPLFEITSKTTGSKDIYTHKQILPKSTDSVLISGLSTAIQSFTNQLNIQFKSIQIKDEKVFGSKFKTISLLKLGDFGLYIEIDGKLIPKKDVFQKMINKFLERGGVKTRNISPIVSKKNFDVYSKILDEIKMGKEFNKLFKEKDIEDIKSKDKIKKIVINFLKEEKFDPKIIKDIIDKHFDDIFNLFNNIETVSKLLNNKLSEISEEVVPVELRALNVFHRKEGIMENQFLSVSRIALLGFLENIGIGVKDTELIIGFFNAIITYSKEIGLATDKVSLLFTDKEDQITWTLKI